MSEHTRIKCTDFVRRTEGLDRDAFFSRWRDDRAQRMRALPGLRGLVFNFVDHTRSPDTRFDAAIEYWFADAVAYQASASARRDETFEHRDVMSLLTREQVIRPLAPGRDAPRAKRIGLVGRKPDMAQAEFFRDWADVHAPPVDRQPGLERYVLNLLTHERPANSAWDGYAALWWTDWSAFENARTFVRNGLQQRLDFFHAHELLMVEEHIELAPDAPL